MEFLGTLFIPFKVTFFGTKLWHTSSSGYPLNHEGQEQGIGAAGAVDGVFGAHAGGEFILQFLDFRAHDVRIFGDIL
jgi:hypothetical protein